QAQRLGGQATPQRAPGFGGGRHAEERHRRPRPRAVLQARRLRRPPAVRGCPAGLRGSHADPGTGPARCHVGERHDRRGADRVGQDPGVLVAVPRAPHGPEGDRQGKGRPYRGHPGANEGARRSDIHGGQQVCQEVRVQGVRRLRRCG
ncbi:unnamed protein product, partial [Ectocarpus sp. 13 AM-2016]